MNKVIHKHSLSIAEINDTVTIVFPQGAIIRHVDCQYGADVTFWYEFDVDETRSQTRKFRIAGTGHTMADFETLYFIGTVLMRNMNLVWHIYEVVERAD